MEREVAKFELQETTGGAEEAGSSQRQRREEGPVSCIRLLYSLTTERREVIRGAVITS